MTHSRHPTPGWLKLVYARLYRQMREKYHREKTIARLPIGAYKGCLNVILFSMETPPMPKVTIKTDKKTIDVKDGYALIDMC